jgi:hypothetical protein
VIRWEQQENGDWHGFSGELLVATVAKDPDAEREQWAWKIHGLKRPKGWRPAGFEDQRVLGRRRGAPGDPWRRRSTPETGGSTESLRSPYPVSLPRHALRATAPGQRLRSYRTPRAPNNIVGLLKSIFIAKASCGLGRHGVH